MVSESEGEEQQLHIIFFPFMAHGHALPMFDLANLFASRGVRSTLALTPYNAALFHDAAAGAAPANVHVRLLHFPAAAFAAAGLLEGTEHCDSLYSQQFQSFFLLLPHLDPPLRRLAGELRPDCIVSDMCFPWTVDVARDLGVPRLVFTGSSYLFNCVSHALLSSSPENHVVPDDEPFAVPGLPDSIELTKSQLPNFQGNEEMKAMWERMMESEKESYGAVMNSFYELEHAFIDHSNTILGRKTWPVGPLSLLNKDKMSKFNRGGKKAAIEVEECLSWLDSKQPRSVLYICFGSVCSFPPAQHGEIAAALESHGGNFVWVVKPREVLPHGFEERVGEKGLVIRGWAPQVLILEHEAIAAFVTHCGWNSTLEGVIAGVPMVTWPVFADQFFNEKLVSRVLRIGVEVGSRRSVANWEEEQGREVLGRAAVEEAVAAVMGDGEEGEGMRRRAKEMGEMGRKAMEEGGSSYLSLGELIEELSDISRQNTKNTSTVNHPC